MKIWNLPLVEYLPFDELEEDGPIIIVTTDGALEVVSDADDLVKTIMPDALINALKQVQKPARLETDEMGQTSVDFSMPSTTTV